MTRPQWHAARRERKELDDWLVTHRKPSTTGCDCNAAAAESWDCKHARWWDLHCLIESAKTRDPHGWRILRENQARRRAHVLARVKQRRLDRAAKALDTTGMSPLRAAMAQLEVSFGGRVA